MKKLFVISALCSTFFVIINADTPKEPTCVDHFMAMTKLAIQIQGLQKISDAFNTRVGDAKVTKMQNSGKSNSVADQKKALEEIGIMIETASIFNDIANPSEETLQAEYNTTQQEVQKCIAANKMPKWVTQEMLDAAALPKK